MTRLSTILNASIVFLALTVSRGAWAGGPVLPLEIDTASGPHVFDVEWEITDAERERGLMDRKTMAANHGMLFDFRPHDEPVMFWMKDTFLPLDMIFIGHDGRVVAIKHDAKPMDESIINSGASTTGVLEVNAGVAETIGVKVGDEVRHAMFGNAAKP
jgi:uncharacterized membrane protein (UPF0127 family)